jgi:DNA-binding MarR family transcriptional regulator
MSTTSLPPLPCMCASLRRLSRALTQQYDEALRPLGLRATQFTVLQALSLAGEVTQGQLGKILAMDSTSLTRTLEIMIRHGWIAKQQGNDRRERRLRLSRIGEGQLERALPYWQKLQTQLRRRLGSERFENLLSVTRDLASALTDSGEPL